MPSPIGCGSDRAGEPGSGQRGARQGEPDGAPRTRHARPPRADPRRRGRQPEPVGRQRRAARHRQGVRLVADHPRPHRGRLLARPRRVGALPRRARRPLRPQDDADRRRAALDPGVPARRVGPDRRRARRRPASSAASRPAWRTRPRSPSSPRCGPGPSRTKSIALWSAIGGGISALGPLVAGALLEHFWWGSVFLVTLPLAVVALVLALRLRAEPRERGDRPGRQPRRRSSRRSWSARSSSASTSLPVPDKGTRRDRLLVVVAAPPGSRSSSASGAPATRSTTSTSRPGASSGSPRSRGHHRVRLADGARCSSASSSSRTCSATTRSRPGPSILPAVVVHGDRRAALGQARRGEGRAVHAAGRLRVLLRSASSRCSCCGTTASRTGRSGSAYALRRHRRRLRRHARVALAHRFGAGDDAPAWRRAPPTSSATSAGRSCSRSSARCSPPATPPRSPSAIAGAPNGSSVSTSVQDAAHEVVLERGRTPRSSTRSTRTRSSPPRRRSFLDGADWAYLAGIIAIVLGAALVFFIFPKHDARGRAPRAVPRRGPTGTDDARRRRDRAPARVSWIRDTDERARRRPADIALLVVSAILALLVGLLGADPVDGQRQPVPDPQRPVREHGRSRQGRLRARVDLGRARGGGGAAGPAPVPASPCTPCSRGAGAWGLPLLLNELARHPRHQRPRRRRAHRRRPRVPGGERRRHHRARVRHRAVHRAPAPAHLRHRHPAGVRWPRCTSAPGFPADVIGGVLVGFGVAALVRVLLRRTRRTAVGRRGASRAHRPRLRRRRHRARRRAHPARRGDGRRARHRRARARRRLRARPARRPHRGQGLAQGDVPRPRRPGVREPGPAGRAHRVHLDARRARARAARAELVRTGVGGADAAVLVTMPPRGTPIGSLPVERVTDAVLRDAWKQLDALHQRRHRARRTSTACASSSTTTARSRSTTSARPTRAASSTGCDRDDAALLVLTAQLVGDDRAVAAMVDGAGQGTGGRGDPGRATRRAPRRRSPRASSTRARR